MYWLRNVLHFMCNFGFGIVKIVVVKNKILSGTVVPDSTISSPDRAKFGENLFSNHTTIHLMNLLASLMLSAAMKRQYSSVLFRCHCLTAFDKICWMAM